MGPCLWVPHAGAGQGKFLPSHQNLPAGHQDGPKALQNSWPCFLKNQSSCLASLSHKFLILWLISAQPDLTTEGTTVGQSQQGTQERLRSRSGVAAALPDTENPLRSRGFVGKQLGSSVWRAVPHLVVTRPSQVAPRCLILPPQPRRYQGPVTTLRPQRAEIKQKVLFKNFFLVVLQLQACVSQNPAALEGEMRQTNVWGQGQGAIALPGAPGTVPVPRHQGEAALRYHHPAHGAG